MAQFRGCLLLSVLATQLAALHPAGAQLARERVDLILHHGKVVTLDNQDRIAAAVIVRDGKIVAVGDEDLLDHYSAARTIDLGGRMVLPGFNDVHTHISGSLRATSSCRPSTPSASSRRTYERRLRSSDPASGLPDMGGPKTTSPSSDCHSAPISMPRRRTIP